MVVIKVAKMNRRYSFLFWMSCLWWQ